MGRGNSVNGFWCAPFVSVNVSGLQNNGSMTSAAYFPPLYLLSLSLLPVFVPSLIEEKDARRKSPVFVLIEKETILVLMKRLDAGS